MNRRRPERAEYLRGLGLDQACWDPVSELAALLAGWELPEEYATLRRQLEARMGQRGKREFVRVLRLMEDFSHQEVHHACRTPCAWAQSVSTP